MSVLDISNTVNWPTATLHTIGSMNGIPARSRKAKVYRILTYDAVLTTGDRTIIFNYLRDKYFRNRIIFNGDSLTSGGAGTGATSMDKTYPMVAKGLITGQYSYWVAAIGSKTIEDLDNTVNPTNVRTQSPNTIVTWAGTNNFILSNQSAATAKAALDTKLANDKAAIPGVRAFVCTLPPDTQFSFGFPAKYRSEAPLFNAAIVADSRYTDGTLADGVIRLDQITELQDATNTTYFYDGLHLTDAGYALVGAAVADAINLADA